MTPLEFLATNPTLAEAEGKAIIASKELRDDLLAKQSSIDVTDKITPVLLSDGRYGVGFEVMLDISEGETYHALFSIIDMAALNTADLVDTATFKALLPLTPTEEI
jgi:hypothetical protein